MADAVRPTRAELRVAARAQSRAERRGAAKAATRTALLGVALPSLAASTRNTTSLRRVTASPARRSRPLS